MAAQLWTTDCSNCSFCGLVRDIGVAKRTISPLFPSFGVPCQSTFSFILQIPK
jgi:hypothetical protein